MKQISDKEVTRLRTLVVSLQGLLDTIESRGAKLSPEQIKRIESFRKKGTCIKCGNPLVAERDTRRDVLHQVCYAEVKRWIKDGKMTEQQAVDEGIWNPVPGKPGRKGRFSKIAKESIEKGTKPLTKSGTNDGTQKS